MKRLDAYLSRKAQAVEPTALVYCDELEEDGSRWERWSLEWRQVYHRNPDGSGPSYSEPETLELGEAFGEAKQAVAAWVHSRRAASVGS